HTRWPRDWSSDVCSSDLLCLLLEIAVALPLLPRAVKYVDWHRIGLLLVAAVVGVPAGNLVLTEVAPEPMRWTISFIVLGAVALRSEERRVGEGWGCGVCG